MAFGLNSLRFIGEDGDIYEWTCRIDKYFTLRDVPGEQRLSLVFYHLEGEALTWFQWLEANCLLTTWSNFLIAIKFRFGSSKFEEQEKSQIQEQEVNEVNVQGFKEASEMVCFVNATEQPLCLENQDAKAEAETCGVSLEIQEATDAAEISEVSQKIMPMYFQKSNDVRGLIGHVNDTKAQVQSDKSTGVCDCEYVQFFDPSGKHEKGIIIQNDLWINSSYKMSKLLFGCMIADMARRRYILKFYALAEVYKEEVMWFSWDESLRTGKVIFRDDGSSEKLGTEYAQMSDEEESDLSSAQSGSSDDEDDSPQGLGFLEGTTLQRGVQTDIAVFVTWENHTRGIASQMMANMGYREGMGFGALGQERLDPNFVKVLPPKQSLDHAVKALDKDENKDAQAKKRSRGGTRKRDKKLAAAAKAAKEEEDCKDVFSLINTQLAMHRQIVNGSSSAKRQQQNKANGKATKEDRWAIFIAALFCYVFAISGPNHLQYPHRHFSQLHLEDKVIVKEWGMIRPTQSPSLVLLSSSPLAH